VSVATSPIAVLGAGSWGCALAIHLARQGSEVRLWDVSAEHIASMRDTRENQRYLPGITLPEKLSLFGDLAETLVGVQDVFCVPPSHAFSQLLTTCQPLLGDDARIAWATKGIDPESYELLDQVAKNLLGDRAYAVLSGPSFAKEVAQGLPTSVTVAANQKAFADDLVRRFQGDNFCLYTSDDLIGVQIGGALKNVYAIAAGISDGLGYGANARCALITRALHELSKLGVAMGAKPQTFMGLSGVGDLVLTCTDNQSRNRRFGLALGEGKTIEQAEAGINQVIEGKTTVEQAMALAKQHNIDMPIAQQIHAIISGHTTPQSAWQHMLAAAVEAEN
jgi:glycerol-3-phosphate dehydrogenase (NAD(P)+)